MKRNNWLLVLTLLLGLGLVLGACGGDDDDDDSSSGDDDTSPDDDDDTGGDDDDTTPDDDDDTTPDDDDDNDTTPDDDDDTEPADTEYDPVVCAIADPESLGGNLTVGGDVVGGVIATYVYDDATCQPVAGADVNGVVTNADGYAEVPAEAKGATLVAAIADGYFGWAIKADAGVMYFRLQPVETAGSFTDSAEGEFVADGQALGLTNPTGTYTIANLLNLLDSTIFLGGAIPGLNRNTLLSTDFTNGLLPTTTWPLTYEYEMDKAGAAKEGETIDMPKNVYFPSLDVDINIIGLVTASASGVNETYQVPVNAAWSEVPIEGLVASIVAGEAVSVDLIIDLISNPDDIIEALMAALPKIINDALMIDHVAGDPAWGGTGAPDLEVVDPIAAKSDVAVTINGAVAGYDYLGIMASEVPNRLLVPQSIKLFDSGAATFPAATMPDSDYVMAIAKTNALEVLGGSDEPVELNLVLKYAENLSEFTSGITINDATDFLPVFADTTAYNEATGVLTWALSKKATPDAYVVIVDPAQDDVFEMGIAVLPGTDSTFDITTFGAVTPSVDDVLVLIGLDLPEGVTLDEFNLPGIIGYNSSAITIWTNYPIAELLNPEL